jgi:hypothetical protein
MHGLPLLPPSGLLRSKGIGDAWLFEGTSRAGVMQTHNAATGCVGVRNAFDVSRLMSPKLIVSPARTDRAVDNAQCGPLDGSDHPSGAGVSTRNPIFAPSTGCFPEMKLTGHLSIAKLSCLQPKVAKTTESD